MPRHVIVDGSNLATEGRPLPSLQQLNDAVMAFMAEHPDALITVVVDATFGHRINSSEVAEFDDAVANNEVVAPPAGAIGRGDAFLLSVANKVGATVLSNDSFQEFHGTYPWLFEDGRLIGGKPVPHIGWVFVARSPVRGPISRGAVKDARRKKDGAAPAPAAAERGGRGRRDKRGPSASAEANLPMPVPKAPPPNATIPGRSAAAPAKQAAAAAAPASKAPAGAAGVNDFTAFLSFVEHQPVGTSINATVETYSSHGAYVKLDGGVTGYLPLRLMSDPPPRSAREFLKIGDSVTLVVESFAPARRSIDLAMASMATAKPPAPAKRGRKAAAPVDVPATPDEPVAKKPASRRKKVAAAEPAIETKVPPAGATPEPQPELTAPTGRKRAAKKAAPTDAPAKRTRAKKTSTTAAPEPAKPAEAAPAKRIRAKKAAKPAAEVEEASPRARARRKPRS